MNESEEKAWIAGNRAAWVSVLAECYKALGVDTEEGKAAALLAEREQTRASLRRLCADYGDNEWDDRLHLVDVVEKHLRCHLDESANAAEARDREE